MEEPKPEEAFTIRVNLNGLYEQILLVLPRLDYEKDESRFIVIDHGQEIGIIWNETDPEFDINPNGTWKWLNENLAAGDAVIIGKEIDRHYFG